MSDKFSQPYDVWFARYDTDLYFVLAPHDDAPEGAIFPAKSVALAMERVRSHYTNIVQVGILPAEMLGLE